MHAGRTLRLQSRLPVRGIKHKHRCRKNDLRTRKPFRINARSNSVHGLHAPSNEYGLPFDDVYDVELLTSYYAPRPGKLVRRLAAITSCAAKIAAAWVLDELMPQKTGVRRGKVLRDVISGMGPVFVKLGQTLSTRPDLIGEEACEALGELQDQMPAFDSVAAFEIIGRELEWDGRICPADSRPGLERAETLFRELTLTPVSAASLGQVYRGYTKEGLEVAVKVQRPELLPEVSRDLYILRTFLAWWETQFQSGALTPDIADSLGAGLFAELDYMKEAANGVAFAEAHAFLTYIAVPKWVPEYTSKRVLTTEWVRGRPIRDLDPMEQIAMARMGVECSVAQLLLTGVLHADPHEGNLLYGDDGKLYFLDFGLLSRMEQRHMEGMASGILHLLSGDWGKLLGDFGKMEVINPPYLKWDWDNKKGWLPMSQDEFNKAFVSTMESAGKDAHDRSSFGELFAELASLGTNYRFTCPPYYILVMRSFVTLEGVASRADPNFNIYSAAIPYAVRRALTPRTSDGRRLLRETLLNERNELRLADLQDMALSAMQTTSSTRVISVEDDASARVLATLQLVLFSTDGKALRRIIWDANSLALMKFISSWTCLSLITKAISNWSPSASPKASALHKGGASIHRQKRLIRILISKHLQGAAKSGLCGWKELAKLAAFLFLPIMKVLVSAVIQAVLGCAEILLRYIKVVPISTPRSSYLINEEPDFRTIAALTT